MVEESRLKGKSQLQRKNKKERQDKFAELDTRTTVAAEEGTGAR